ncbi:MAG: hypothetical protein SFX18_02160 [Pirellulales bacterium]|nr:hypothetical protein [Pirellulales bacterium]
MNFNLGWLRPLWLGVMVAGMFCQTSGMAVAATSTYTSSADFFTALGATPFVTETYESYPINSTIPAGTLLNGINYDSFPIGADGRVDNNYNRLGDASLALQRGLNSFAFFFPGESFSVTFENPVYGVGIFFNVVESPVDSLFINTPVGNALTGGATYDQGTLYFAGLISDTPFSSVTIGGDATIGSGYNVDNLTYVTNPIPEPSAWMVTAGLLGLACWVRRGATRA